MSPCNWSMAEKISNLCAMAVLDKTSRLSDSPYILAWGYLNLSRPLKSRSNRPCFNMTTGTYNLLSRFKKYGLESGCVYVTQAILSHPFHYDSSG